VLYLIRLYKLLLPCFADNAINEVLCTSIYAALGHSKSFPFQSNSICFKEIIHVSVLLLALSLVSDDAFDVSQLTLQLTRNIFPYFYSQLSSTGWTTSHALLGADEWRSAWGKDLNLNGVN